MKSILSLSLIGLFVGCQMGEVINSNPKSSVTYYNAKGIKTGQENFNADGKIKEDLTFDEDGNVTDRLIYEYDSRSLLIERKNSASQSRTYYYYGAKGRQIMEVNESADSRDTIISYYLNDGLLRVDYNKSNNRTITREYDGEGNEIKTVRLNDKGDTTGFSEYVYNDENLEIESRDWDGDQLYRHRKRTYNASGEIIEEQYFDALGDMEMHYVNTYDRYGRIKSIARFTGDQEDFKLDYNYKGDERTCTTYISGAKNKTTKEVYTYFPDDEPQNTQ